MAANLHIEWVDVGGRRIEGHVRGGVMLPPHGRNWQVHLATTRPLSWRPGDHVQLRIGTREGGEIEGDVVVRRSDGMAHHLVGESVPAQLTH